MSQERDARELIGKAEKKLKSWFSGTQSKNEEASELFQRAAALFKLAKNWKEGAEAFLKSADCELRLNNQHEAAMAYVDSANCYKKFSDPDAIRCLERAVEIFTDMGKFSIAAKTQKDVAEMLEGTAELQQAIEAFNKAADYYECEESASTANQCKLKAALYYAQLENYSEAIAIYEKIANNSVDSSLTRWSVKDYFFRATLCHVLLHDAITARAALNRYKDIDVSFPSTRECKFLQDMLEAVEEGDVEKFTAIVYDFDNISKLDSWKTTMLLRVKNNIQNEELL
eukprot:GCRY01001273.1.p1 GENE.GCRY01001273.1~~GCRY01001273.1.p1  ORF type:complete len:285 (+),score=48.90 GCRY01001273.1:121-975(+)